VAVAVAPMHVGRQPFVSFMMQADYWRSTPFRCPKGTANKAHKRPFQWFGILQYGPDLADGFSLLCLVGGVRDRFVRTLMFDL
jgi:hypothetical protein